MNTQSAYIRLSCILADQASKTADPVTGAGLIAASAGALLAAMEPDAGRLQAHIRALERQEAVLTQEGKHAAAQHLRYAALALRAALD